MATSRHRALAAREWLWHKDEILPFNGKITVWFVVGQLLVDAHEGVAILQLGVAILQLGEGLQVKTGWNWKTKTPILGALMN